MRFNLLTKFIRMKKTIFSFVALIVTSIAFAQVGGTISDTDNNPLPGATVVVKGTTNGATTDFDGAFNIDANQGDVLVISFVGFETQEVAYDGSVLSVVMQEGVSLDEVLVTGNRNKPRTAIDSAVPIDNIRVSDIQNAGEASLQRALTFAIPSFNAQDQAISDATAGFAPADIRGLGPSRTLVLINGKRVNQQAQAYWGMYLWSCDLLSNKTKTICNMSDIASRVKAIIVDKLGVDENEVVTEASFTNDLGADSLDTVELIMEFEKEFDIQIPDDQAENIATVGQAIQYIEQTN